VAKERRMELKEAYLKYKKLKVPSLSVIREKASKHSKTSLFIVILFVVFLALALQYIPYFQVAHFGIANPKT
jgi:heme O synthase-like polyprenyltransferase